MKIPDIRDLRDLNKNDLLHYLGLETKRSVVDWALSGAGVFAVGILVGAGVGLLFAPKAGNEMRSHLAHRFCKGKKSLESEAPSAPM